MKLISQEEIKALVAAVDYSEALTITATKDDVLEAFKQIGQT